MWPGLMQSLLQVTEEIFPLISPSLSALRWPTGVVISMFKKQTVTSATINWLPTYPSVPPLRWFKRKQDFLLLAPLDRASSSSGQPSLRYAVAGSSSHPPHPLHILVTGGWAGSGKCQGKVFQAHSQLQAACGPLGKQYETFQMVLLMALHKYFTQLCQKLLITKMLGCLFSFSFAKKKMSRLSVFLSNSFTGCLGYFCW